MNSEPGSGATADFPAAVILPAGLTSSDCWTVAAALAPGAAVGIFYFGLPALLVLLTSTAGCVACAVFLRRLLPRRAPVSNVAAALAGLLLGMSLAPAVPAGFVLAGSAVAVLLGTLVVRRGGFNPLAAALGARVVLLLVSPDRMTNWSPPAGLFTAASEALSAAAAAPLAARSISLLDGLVGRLPGGVGETSVIALGLGGAFLIWRGVVTWQIPVSFLGAVVFLAWAGSAIDPERFPGAGFHLGVGGLMLGAVFLATDAATAPVTTRGKLVYGAGCGVLTWLIRSFGKYPEGVSFAIALMALVAPLIDQYTRPGLVEGTGSGTGAARTDCG